VNAASDRPRHTVDPAWAAPDAAPADPPPGSGLAWLSRVPEASDGASAGSAAFSWRRPDEVSLPGAPGGVLDGAAPPGVGLPGLAGGWPAGQVVTWLPDGRWVSADASADDIARPDAGPDPLDPGAAVRRRGERRIALARVGARLGGWPRRVLVGLLLVAAGLLALRPHPAVVAAAPAPPTTEVVVAARDLAAGTVLAPADLRTVPMPVSVVPAGVARRTAALVGRLAAGAIRRGETVTDARVVGPGLTAGLGSGETAAVPVRLADPDAAALVRAGDRVDVLGTPVAPDGTQPVAGEPVDVATGVRVLAVLGSRDAADGVVLVVAASQQTARRLVGAAARHRLTVSVRPP
jgi:Flp pilus assembly protein CpaB